MNKKILLSSALSLILFSIASLPTYGHRNIKPRTQNITVRFTSKGYQPKNIRLRKGVRTRLTFIRQSDEECGQQLTIPAYNVTRELPLKKPVTVEFTPRRSGTFGFSCGMNMFRGKLIIS